MTGGPTNGAPAAGAAPDPVTIEIVTHRLHEITTETADTLERVGGTVNTTQMKDYIAAIYRRDGVLVSAGERASWHTYCAGRAVREVIRAFAGDVRPGDMFLLNDPYVAAVHQSDMYLVSPVHVDEELVGWSATFVHVMDVGAVSPGGNSPDAREIEHEGLRFGALRIVDAGELRTDVVDLLVGMTRQPEMVGLDLRCQAAANHVARERLVQLYRRYGIPLVEAVHAHNIDAGQRVVEDRLAEIADCDIAESLTVPVTPTESVTLACTLRKRGRRVKFDFGGSSPQSTLGVNLPRQATEGACVQAIFDSLGRDLFKTEGVFRPVTVVTEEGSVVACRYPAPVSLNTTSGGAATKTLAVSLVSRMAATSERWRHVARPRPLGHRLGRHAGVSQHGKYYVSILQSLNGGSPTSRSDGHDTSSGELTAHNVEWLEANFPLLQLYRRMRPGSGGAGLRRGGVGEEHAYMLHRAPERTLRLVTLGALGNSTAGHGMFGGLPGWPSELLVDAGRATSADLRRLGPSGDPRVPWYEDGRIDAGDLLVIRASGGPGMGDPLLRDPERVRRDVHLRRLTEEAALDQYGVVLAAGEVDAGATAATRAARRAERRAAALAAGWSEEGAGGDGCDPAAGTCQRVFRGLHDGDRLPTVRVGATALGWRPALGYVEPTFELTLCPDCWSLVDCQVVEAAPTGG